MKCLMKYHWVNETEDGAFRFDEIRAMVALDFARTEIEKTLVKPD